MRVRFRLIGKPKVASQIRRLRAELTGASMGSALEAAALPLENAWKRNIRSYPLVRTGSYLRSVHHSAPLVTAERASIEVGSDITDPPYPFFLEFGTSRMSPKPTARPAADESGPEVRGEFSAAMKQLLGSIG